MCTSFSGLSAFSSALKHPAKCLLHWSTHSRLNTGLYGCYPLTVIMDSTEIVLCLLDHLLTLWPHPITFTDASQHGTAERLTRPLREVNNLAAVTPGFWRLSVNMVHYKAATSRLRSLYSRRLMSLSDGLHVGWGCSRTQNESCLDCCARLCGW